MYDMLCLTGAYNLKKNIVRIVRIVCLYIKR